MHMHVYVQVSTVRSPHYACVCIHKCIYMQVSAITVTVTVTGYLFDACLLETGKTKLAHATLVRNSQTVCRAKFPL